jgi:hypothetical protein
LQLPEDAGEVTFDRAVLAHPSLAVGHLDRRLARLSRSVRFLGLLHPTEVLASRPSVAVTALEALAPALTGAAGTVVTVRAAGRADDDS